MAKRFITEWYCTECDHRISWHEKMYSHGRCPHCGHKGDGAGTVVDTTEKSKEVEYLSAADIWNKVTAFIEPLWRGDDDGDS